MIGTGLTVSARRTLRVRLVKTTDPDHPVRLRVTARGEAARGSRDKVLERAPQLVLGGDLRRRGGAYAWNPVLR
jgi:hypothetical protein